MITASNGILIVALTFGLGLHWHSNWLIAAAFAMAGLSYLVNVCDEREITIGRGVLFWLTVGIGLVTYLYIGMRLLGSA